MHGGLTDPRELGRKGGSRSPLTKLRKSARVDDELREQAREVLAKALRGEQVDREALLAAKSLFSYRPDVAQVPQREQQGSTGRMVFGIADLLRVAAEVKLLSQSGVLDANTERRLFERLGGERDEGWAASEVVVGADERTPSPQRDFSRANSQGIPSAHAKSEPRPPSPEQLSDLVGDADAPDFDESEQAKLTRRYGDDTAAGYRW
jgi:hypothetical protein